MRSNDLLHEKLRLLELEKYQVLDTPPEAAYDDLVELATTICEAPVGLISLIDGKRQWFKACVGLGIAETPREIAFCNYVVAEEKPLIVEDATIDPRFMNNPFVTGEPKIRFYAGVPLFSGVYVLGSLCVIDKKPRRFSEREQKILETLARQVVSQLELRYALKELNTAQVQLVQKQHKYASLLDDIREIVFQTDEIGRWTFLSSAWEQVLGYSVEASIGRKVIEFVDPADRTAALNETIENDKKLGSFLRRQIRYVKMNGDPCWFEVSSRTVLDNAGRVTGTVGTLLDITEQKAQEQLIEIQKIKLVNSARLYALGEMAAGIAHEINNPLAVIRGTAQMLGRTLVSGKLSLEVVQDAVVKIDSTVGRISKIISGLRSFARDGGTDPFVEVPVDSIITDSLELCQARFKNAGIRLDLENTVSDMHIECRPVQVSQVLLNLLNNAFDAVATSEKKQIRLLLHDLGAEIEIKVFDSGHGIPREVRERIMEPFFSTKGPSRGMGLGLSLSKGLVESHGGSLTLNDGDGYTCFSVVLPKRQNVLHKRKL